MNNVGSIPFVPLQYWFTNTQPIHIPRSALINRNVSISFSVSHASQNQKDNRFS